MAARSWVESANGASTDFPLENLPCGVFSTEAMAPRCGAAIGDLVLDVAALEAEGVSRFPAVHTWTSHAGTRRWRPARASGRRCAPG